MLPGCARPPEAEDTMKQPAVCGGRPDGCDPNAAARADRAVDGNRLYELCRPNTKSSTFCGDYVLSIADALMLGRVGRWTACLPIGVKDDQVIDVAERFLRRIPRSEVPPHRNWSPKPSPRHSRADEPPPEPSGR
jgi:hypothetical protein